MLGIFVLPENGSWRRYDLIKREETWMCHVKTTLLLHDKDKEVFYITIIKPLI